MRNCTYRITVFPLIEAGSQVQAGYLIEDGGSDTVRCSNRSRGILHAALGLNIWGSLTLPRDDGGAEGPRSRREAPRGLGLGRGAVVAPGSPVWGSAPRKFFKFNVQIYAFSCYFCVKQYAESDYVLPLKYIQGRGNRYSLLSIFLVGIWQQNLAHVPTTHIS